MAGLNQLGAPFFVEPLFNGSMLILAVGLAVQAAQRSDEELIAYMKTGSGRHKVLFGSNHPMIRPAHALDGLDELGLDDETRALYLGGNATRVFGL